MTIEAVRLSQQNTKTSILTDMRSVAPPGQNSLDSRTIGQLRTLTSSLMAVNADEGLAERQRFLGLSQRSLSLSTDHVADAINGRNILIFGGNGCIGTTLLDQLDQYNPRRVVSVGLGSMPSPFQDIEHREIDMRDKDRVRGVVGSVKPDIIYHLAGQRDPSLAEKQIGQTLSTNIFGTENIIAAAREHGTPQIVYASTGKALRPFTLDTYAFTKKMGEWQMAQYAQTGESKVSGARYTHIVDNSIIYNRIQSWIENDLPIRLHEPEIPFYLQSARESAQLLLNATVEPQQGVYTVHAIRDLQWPMSSVDLAVGELMTHRATTPIYISGYDEGYEAHPYPQTYDNMLAGDVSPLISAFEAPRSFVSIECPEVDIFPVAATQDASLEGHLRKLELVSTQPASTQQRKEAMEIFSWALWDAQLRTMPRTTLERVAHRAARYKGSDGELPEHVRTTQAVINALAA